MGNPSVHHFQQIETDLNLKVISLSGNLSDAKKLGLNIRTDDYLPDALGKLWTEQLASVCTHTLDEGQTGSTTQDRLLRGTPLFLKFSVEPCVTSRMISGIRLTIQDMTINKQLDQQERLRIKMLSIANLANQLVHRMNNPLAAVLNRIGGLLVEDFETIQRDYLRGELEAVQEQIYSLSVITNSLTAFSNEVNQKYRLLKIDHVLENSVELARMVHSRDAINFDLDISSDLPRVLGSEIILEQAIVNIIRNAIEAVGKGGSIQIKAFAEDRFGDFVKIIISDKGSGFDNASWETIFEPFYTTKKDHSGLGLSVAYAIVSNHGGVLEAFSEPEQGSSFIMSLPIAKL